MTRPPSPLFSFGFYPYDRLLDMRDMVRVVKAGEEAGFDILSLPEHLLPPPGMEDLVYNRTWWDLPALCSYLAAHTTRLRFMFGVSVLPYHEPITFAKALVTLDHVSNGRLILGAGSGWNEEEAQRLGYSFAERGDITDEYLAAIKELWTSDTPSYKGKYVAFEDVSFYPKPVQKPHPPIIVGGTGPRPFRRVAQMGDGWSPLSGTFDEVKEQANQIRDLTRKAGRDPDELWFMRSVPWSFGDAEKARQHGPLGSDSAPAREDSSTADVIGQVKASFDAGFNVVSIGFGWETADELVRQLEQVGREVIQAVR